MEASESSGAYHIGIDEAYRPLPSVYFAFMSIWYSCLNLHTCSLWMSFGAYVTGVLFQTASFVSFLLISHGYCIMCERLSVPECRTTAALGCAFYLTHVGYRASAPYFSEMDAATFKDFSSHDWHIGVPIDPSQSKNMKDSILVIIQHPHAYRPTSVNSASDPKSEMRKARHPTGGNVTLLDFHFISAQS
ncbi:hypothetical protein U1Q18_026944 [Sarracenia purpurea var. burkii]